MADLPITIISNISKVDTSHDDNHDQIIEFPLPGFRFHPTDQELVGFYLKRKIQDERLNNRIDQLIKQVDIYKYDPWDLPKYFGGGDIVGHKEWYFFCKRGRKYKNSIRPNRVTGSGFWKATGIDRQIMQGSTSYDSSCIGLKKSLVYYRGNAGKGLKTDWMMHEFRLPSGSNSSTPPPPPVHHHHYHHLLPLEAEVWTLCRILKRDTPYNKYTRVNNTLIHEVGTKKVINVKCTENINNSCDNNIDFMNDNKSFISFTSVPTTSTWTSIKPREQNEKKRHLPPDPDHHQITTASQLIINNSISDHDHNPSDPSYINFHNSPEMDHDATHESMIKYANWDELRHVVEFFDDPYHV